jgi:hypothetical protein
MNCRKNNVVFGEKRLFLEKKGWFWSKKQQNGYTKTALGAKATNFL